MTSCRGTVQEARKVRILCPTGESLFTRGFGGWEAAAATRDLGGQTEHLWQRFDVAAVPYETSTPPSWEAYPWLQVSQSGSWDEVVQWALPRYHVPLASRPVVRARADELAAADEDPMEQALAAVPSELWFERYDLVSTVVNGIYLLSLAVAAVTFIRWHRTMIRNIRFLGCERPDHDVGIVTAGWFIPLVSLVLPVVSLLEVARWSRPPGARPAGALLGWWWGSWIISSLILSAASVVYLVGTTAESWVAGAATDAVGTLLLLGAGVLAVKVVRTLTSWQLRLRDARAEDRSRNERQCYDDRDAVAENRDRRATD